MKKFRPVAELRSPYTWTTGDTTKGRTGQIHIDWRLDRDLRPTVCTYCGARGPLASVFLP